VTYSADARKRLWLLTCISKWVPRNCVIPSGGKCPKEGAAMPVKEAYLERVVGEVEKLAAKVAHLKTQLAQQNGGLQLRYYWELEYLRKRFAEFKQRVEELEEADDSRSKALFESVELIWRDLEHTIEGLLRGLP
jgi:hypothetical protein